MISRSSRTPPRASRSAWSATAWRPALTDLAELGPLLRLYDNHDVLRALFAREFVARYGPGGSTGDVYGFARLVPDLVVKGTRLDQADPACRPMCGPC